MTLGVDYPYGELEAAWHTVLLNQFHDILPGTSIAWVHREAEARYAEVAVALERLIATALSALVGPGTLPIVVNAGPRRIGDVPALSGTPARTEPRDESGTIVARPDGSFELDNGLVRAVVDERGLLTSVRDLAADREVLAPDQPGKLLQVFRDTPMQWDSWDIDEHYRRHGRDLTEADEVTLVTGTAATCVRVTRSVGPPGSSRRSR